MPATEKSAYELLKKLAIPYQRYDHPPIVSSKNVPFNLPGQQVKNLLLKPRKGDKAYLVILPEEKEADLKKLAKILGEKRLSFVSSENLLKLLGVPAGTVTPLALPDDQQHQVTVIVDQAIDQQDTVGFHPNINSTTVLFQFQDFLKILEHLGYVPRFVAV